MAQLAKAHADGRLEERLTHYAKPKLLIIDELGYLPLPAEAASALFQVISQRYLKTSVVLTSNRGVGAWGEILGDTTVAAAIGGGGTTPPPPPPEPRFPNFAKRYTSANGYGAGPHEVTASYLGATLSVRYTISVRPIIRPPQDPITDPGPVQENAG